MDDSKKITGTLFFLVFTQLVNAQPWRPFLCTADSRSSLAIQLVDENWNPLPFDCENTAVLIEGEEFQHEIKPGNYTFCPKKVFQRLEHEDRRKGPVFVLNDNPGLYQVTVSRFDEVSTFQDVLIEMQEDGCHAKQVFLEVQFDMSKTQ